MKEKILSKNIPYVGNAQNRTAQLAKKYVNYTS